jgi:hypothetical protein
MKNLKKSLALVLAIVMVFSLVVFANAEFADADQISPKFADACGVMNGLGILKGDQDGVFNPQGTLTRGQAMKIITYLKLGKGADSLTATSAPFNDVPTTAWEAPFVAYCKNAKITNGYGDGNFGKDDELSGYAFAKFLLAALGYGANEEYVGDEWKIAVASDALSLGLFQGIEGYLSDEPLPREVAAQLAFNAAQIAPVKYVSIFEMYQTAGNPFCVSPLDFDPDPVLTGTDAAGRPVKKYVTLSSPHKTIYQTTAEAVYTTADGYDAAIAANKNFVIDSETVFKLNTAASSQAAIQALGVGPQIEFYGAPTSDGKVKITNVVATDYEFATVKAVTDTKVTLSTGDITDAAELKLLAGFVKDDALAIVKNGTALVGAVKATPVTGEKVTATTATTASIDGNKYTVAHNYTGDLTIKTGAFKGTFYTSPSGAIIGSIGEATAPVAKVYVYAVVGYTTTGAPNEYGESTPSYFVQAVNEAGEAVNYQTKTDMTSITAGVYELKIVNDKGVDYAEFVTDTDDSDGDAIASETSVAVTATDKKTAGNTYYVNNGTKFIVVTGSKASIKVEVVEKIPTFDSTGNIFYHYTKTGSNKTASVIFTTAKLKGAEQPSTGYAYTKGLAVSTSSALVKNAKGEDVTGWAQSVYVDGVKKDIYVADTANTTYPEGFYEMKADGDITSLTAVTKDTLLKQKAVTNNAAGYLTTADVTDLPYANATFVNLIPTNTTVTSADKIPAGAEVALVLNSTKTEIAVIYLITLP